MLHVGEVTRRGVAGEDRYGVAAERRDVDVTTVRAHEYLVRPLEPLHAVHAVLLHSEPRERAARRVAAEGHDGVVAAAGDIHVLPIGADRGAVGARDTRHAAVARLE